MRESERSRPGSDARRVAWQALQRIDHQGAYANLVLDGELRRSQLDEQDRRFATQLIYGTTRMRRACDFLVDRFLLRSVDDEYRSLLRLGAYQLHFLSTPAHAAVDSTVSIAPRKVRGFVNAVLRKVASAEVIWPDEATRLSYPDWLVSRLGDDIGVEASIAMLERMNVEPAVHQRDDGYVQDPASAWVCDVVGANPGDLVLDACAAPGGKTTLLARNGANVIATDRRRSRANLVVLNARRVGAESVHVAVLDATMSSFRPGSFDRVLVDAPCSGLGVLRRRSDARWRIDAEGIERLAALQRRLVAEAQTLVRPGGRLVYSVCTVTRAETVEIANEVSADFDPIRVSAEGGHWRPVGEFGAQVLPQDHDTDGMTVFGWDRNS